MIDLTRTSGERCSLDPAEIQRIEAGPETVVYLADGAKYVVVQSMEQVIARIREFRAAVTVTAWRVIDAPADPGEPTGAAIVPFPQRTP